MLRSR
jgi:hypothetical protein